MFSIHIPIYNYDNHQNIFEGKCKLMIMDTTPNEKCESQRGLILTEDTISIIGLTMIHHKCTFSLSLQIRAL